MSPEKMSEAFDLNVMIDESLALVQAKALEKGVELRRAGQQYFADELPTGGRNYSGKFYRIYLATLLSLQRAGPSSCLHRLKNPVRTMLRS